MNSSSFPLAPRLVSVLLPATATMAITNVNDWLAVCLPLVATALAEYVPAGVVLLAVTTNVPLCPPVPAMNCELTPLGKLLAVTLTELPGFAPPMVTPSCVGVPSIAVLEHGCPGAGTNPTFRERSQFCPENTLVSCHVERRRRMGFFRKANYQMVISG